MNYKGNRQSKFDSRKGQYRFHDSSISESVWPNVTYDHHQQGYINYQQNNQLHRRTQSFSDRGRQNYQSWTKFQREDNTAGYGGRPQCNQVFGQNDWEQYGAERQTVHYTSPVKSYNAGRGRGREVYNGTKYKSTPKKPGNDNRRQSLIYISSGRDWKSKEEMKSNKNNNNLQGRKMSERLGSPKSVSPSRRKREESSDKESKNNESFERKYNKNHHDSDSNSKSKADNKTVREKENSEYSRRGSPYQNSRSKYSDSPNTKRSPSVRRRFSHSSSRSRSKSIERKSRSRSSSKSRYIRSHSRSCDRGKHSRSRSREKSYKSRQTVTSSHGDSREYSRTDVTSRNLPENGKTNCSNDKARYVQNQERGRRPECVETKQSYKDLRCKLSAERSRKRTLSERFGKIIDPNQISDNGSESKSNAKSEDCDSSEIKEVKPFSGTRELSHNQDKAVVDYPAAKKMKQENGSVEHNNKSRTTDTVTTDEQTKISVNKEMISHTSSESKIQMNSEVNITSDNNISQENSPMEVHIEDNLSKESDDKDNLESESKSNNDSDSSTNLDLALEDLVEVYSPTSDSDQSSAEDKQAENPHPQNSEREIASDTKLAEKVRPRPNQNRKDSLLEENDNTVVIMSDKSIMECEERKNSSKRLNNLVEVGKCLSEDVRVLADVPQRSASDQKEVVSPDSTVSSNTNDSVFKDVTKSDNTSDKESHKSNGKLRDQALELLHSSKEENNTKQSVDQNKDIQPEDSEILSSKDTRKKSENGSSVRSEGTLAAVSEKNEINLATPAVVNTKATLKSPNKTEVASSCKMTSSNKVSSSDKVISSEKSRVTPSRHEVSPTKIRETTSVLKPVGISLEKTEILSSKENVVKQSNSTDVKIPDNSGGISSDIIGSSPKHLANTSCRKSDLAPSQPTTAPLSKAGISSTESHNTSCEKMKKVKSISDEKVNGASRAKLSTKDKLKPSTESKSTTKSDRPYDHEKLKKSHSSTLRERSGRLGHCRGIVNTDHSIKSAETMKRMQKYNRVEKRPDISKKPKVKSSEKSVIKKNVSGITEEHKSQKRGTDKDSNCNTSESKKDLRSKKVKSKENSDISLSEKSEDESIMETETSSTFESEVDETLPKLFSSASRRIAKANLKKLKPVNLGGNSSTAISKIKRQFDKEKLVSKKKVRTGKLKSKQSLKEKIMRSFPQELFVPDILPDVCKDKRKGEVTVGGKPEHSSASSSKMVTETSRVGSEKLSPSHKSVEQVKTTSQITESSDKMLSVSPDMNRTSSQSKRTRSLSGKEDAKRAAKLVSISSSGKPVEIKSEKGNVSIGDRNIFDQFSGLKRKMSISEISTDSTKKPKLSSGTDRSPSNISHLNKSRNENGKENQESDNKPSESTTKNSLSMKEKLNVSRTVNKNKISTNSKDIKHSEKDKSSVIIQSDSEKLENNGKVDINSRKGDDSGSELPYDDSIDKLADVKREDGKCMKMSEKEISHKKDETNEASKATEKETSIIHLLISNIEGKIELFDSSGNSTVFQSSNGAVNCDERKSSCDTDKIKKSSLETKVSEVHPSTSECETSKASKMTNKGRTKTCTVKTSSDKICDSTDHGPSVGSPSSDDICDSENTSSSAQTLSSVNTSSSVQTLSSVNTSSSAQTLSSVNTSSSAQTLSSVNTSSSVQTVSSVNTSSSVQTLSSVNTSSSAQTLSSVNTSSSAQTLSSVNTSRSVQTVSSVNTSSSVQTLSSVNTSSSDQTLSSVNTSSSAQTVSSVTNNEQSKGCQKEKKTNIVETPSSETFDSEENADNVQGSSTECDILPEDLTSREPQASAEKERDKDFHGRKSDTDESALLSACKNNKNEEANSTRDDISEQSVTKTNKDSERNVEEGEERTSSVVIEREPSEESVSSKVDEFTAKVNVNNDGDISTLNETHLKEASGNQIVEEASEHTVSSEVGISDQTCTTERQEQSDVGISDQTCTTDRQEQSDVGMSEQTASEIDKSEQDHVGLCNSEDITHKHGHSEIDLIGPVSDDGDSLMSSCNDTCQSEVTESTDFGSTDSDQDSRLSFKDLKNKFLDIAKPVYEDITDIDTDDDCTNLIIDLDRAPTHSSPLKTLTTCSSQSKEQGLRNITESSTRSGIGVNKLNLGNDVSAVLSLSNTESETVNEADTTLVDKSLQDSSYQCDTDNSLLDRTIPYGKSSSSEDDAEASTTVQSSSAAPENASQDNNGIDDQTLNHEADLEWLSRSSEGAQESRYERIDDEDDLDDIEDPEEDCNIIGCFVRGVPMSPWTPMPATPATPYKPEMEEDDQDIEFSVPEQPDTHQTSKNDGSQLKDENLHDDSETSVQNNAHPKSYTDELSSDLNKSHVVSQLTRASSVNESPPQFRITDVRSLELSINHLERQFQDTDKMLSEMGCDPNAPLQEKSLSDVDASHTEENTDNLANVKVAKKLGESEKVPGKINRSLSEHEKEVSETSMRSQSKASDGGNHSPQPIEKRSLSCHAKISAEPQRKIGDDKCSPQSRNQQNKTEVSKSFLRFLSNLRRENLDKYKPIHFTHIKTLDSGNTMNTIGILEPSQMRHCKLLCVKCAQCMKYFSPHMFLLHIDNNTDNVNKVSLKAEPWPTGELSQEDEVIWNKFLFILRNRVAQLFTSETPSELQSEVSLMSTDNSTANDDNLPIDKSTPDNAMHKDMSESSSDHIHQTSEDMATNSNMHIPKNVEGTSQTMPSDPGQEIQNVSQKKQTLSKSKESMDQRSAEKGLLQNILEQPMTTGSLPGPMIIGSLPGPMKTGSLHGPITIGSVPGPMNTGIVQGPITIGSVPGPIITGSVPGPTNTGSVPGPMIIGSVSGPMNTGSVPMPMIIGSVPGPMNTGCVPGPMIIGSVPGPMNTRSLQGPVTTGRLAGPMTIGSLPGPVTTGSLPGPVTTGSLPGPVTTGSLAGPMTTGSLPGPVTTGSLPGSVTTGSLPGPVTKGSLPGPVTTGSLPGSMIQQAVACVADQQVHGRDGHCYDAKTQRHGLAVEKPRFSTEMQEAQTVSTSMASQRRLSLDSDSRHLSSTNVAGQGMIPSNTRSGQNILTIPTSRRSDGMQSHTSTDFDKRINAVIDLSKDGDNIEMLRKKQTFLTQRESNPDPQHSSVSHVPQNNNPYMNTGVAQMSGKQSRLLPMTASHPQQQLALDPSQSVLNQQRSTSSIQKHYSVSLHGNQQLQHKNMSGSSNASYSARDSVVASNPFQEQNVQTNHHGYSNSTTECNGCNKTITLPIAQKNYRQSQAGMKMQQYHVSAKDQNVNLKSQFHLTNQQVDFMNRGHPVPTRSVLDINKSHSSAVNPTATMASMAQQNSSMEHTSSMTSMYGQFNQHNARSRVQQGPSQTQRQAPSLTRGLLQPEGATHASNAGQQFDQNAYAKILTRLIASTTDCEKDTAGHVPVNTGYDQRPPDQSQTRLHYSSNDRHNVQSRPHIISNFDQQPCTQNAQTVPPYWDIGNRMVASSSYQQREDWVSASCKPCDQQNVSSRTQSSPGFVYPLSDPNMQRTTPPQMKPTPTSHTKKTPPPHIQRSPPLYVQLTTAPCQPHDPELSSAARERSTDPCPNVQSNTSGESTHTSSQLSLQQQKCAHPIISRSPDTTTVPDDIQAMQNTEPGPPSSQELSPPLPGDSSTDGASEKGSNDQSDYNSPERRKETYSKEHSLDKAFRESSNKSKGNDSLQDQENDYSPVGGETSSQSRKDSEMPDTPIRKPTTAKPSTASSEIVNLIKGPTDCLKAFTVAQNVMLQCVTWMSTELQEKTEEIKKLKRENEEQKAKMNQTRERLDLMEKTMAKKMMDVVDMFKK